jgi:cell division protein FtsW
VNVLRLIPFFDPTLPKWASEARFLQWITGIWLLLGLIILYSASYNVAIAEFGDGLYYIKRQLLGIILGVLALGVVVRSPLRKFIKYSPIGFFICLALIFAVRMPGIGSTVNGATRWIQLGPIPLQPSELMKPFLVLQSAQVFGSWERLSWRDRSIWVGLFGLTLAGILIQPNLSTTALCGISLWLIALAAGVSWRLLSGVCLGGIGVAVLSISLAEYQRRRVMSFFNPWADPLQDGYQLIQSLLGVASGGVLGNGFGVSQQKSYLPFQHTDFIYSVFADEFGLIGGVLLFLFLSVFSLVALKIAIKSERPTYRLIAMGSMIFLLVQSLVHIGVTIGALPTTGLPFPFISYGSNSLIASCVLAGLIIRVAREQNEADIIPMHNGRLAWRNNLSLVNSQSPTNQVESDSEVAPGVVMEEWQRRKRALKASARDQGRPKLKAKKSNRRPRKPKT